MNHISFGQKILLRLPRISQWDFQRLLKRKDESPAHPMPGEMIEKAHHQEFVRFLSVFREAFS